VHRHVPVLRIVFAWNRSGVPMASPFSDGSTTYKPRTRGSVGNLTQPFVPASARPSPAGDRVSLPPDGRESVGADQSHVHR
jgi:hypothetical protein